MFPGLWVPYFHTTARFALQKRPGPLFWAESVLAAVAAFLAVLTLGWHDWIEGVFGFDPDHGNGSFEWQLVIVCCLLTVLCSVLAGRRWHRAPAAGRLQLLGERVP